VSPLVPLQLTQSEVESRSRSGSNLSVLRSQYSCCRV